MVEIGDNQIGVVVDSVEDVMRAPRQTISPLPTTLASTEGSILVGICKLPDRLIMLLDFDRLMSADMLGQPGAASVLS